MDVCARQGVVIATGGFGANMAMRRRHLPQADTGWSLQPDTAQGEGIRLAIDAGGVMIADNYQNGGLTTVSACRSPAGTLAVYSIMVLSISAARMAGKECLSTCRSRRSQEH